MTNVWHGRMIQNGHRGESAVDVDRFAGDEAAGDGREQQQRRADQFRCVAQAAHRRVAKDRFDARLVEDLAVLLGGEEAGAEAIDAHAVWGEFAGDVLREAEHGRLRRRVDEHSRQRAIAGHAADVEDRAAAGVDHVLAEDLAAEMRGEQIRVDDAVEIFVGDFEIGRRRIDAGAVDEGVDAAVLLDDGVEQCFHRFAVGGVDFGEGRLAAEFFDFRDACVAALFAAAGDDDRRAGLGQAVAQLAAEHAGAADDDGDLAIESKQFLQVVGHSCRSAEPRRIVRVKVPLGSRHFGAAFANPIGVERAGLVGAFVGVGAEVVALGLQQVCRQAVAAVAVVVGQGGGERGDGDAEFGGRCDDVPPRVLGFVDRFGEVRREQQVFELRIGVERFFDAVEEHGPDDAAAAPEHGTVAVVERPVVFRRGRLHLHEALGVAADLRGVERVANLIDELLLVAGVFGGRAFEDFARPHAAVFHRREAAGVDGFGDQRAGTPWSSASWLIHLPVPLAPALSMILSTRKPPESLSLTLKMSRVISMR